MPISHTPLIERIARVLAGLRLSENADGTEPSASRSVDLEWEGCLEDARAVLRTMREPDAAMASAGNEEIWEAMIAAALSGEASGTGVSQANPDETNPLAPPINLNAGS